MASLIVGPMLRYVGETDATLFVETDEPCEVEVLGHRARTFHVSGHHYALVIVDGLKPGAIVRYDLRLDGRLVWPAPESPFPPPTIRTVDPSRTVRLSFGSCRAAAPHEPPYTLEIDEHPKGRGIDALCALTERLKVDPVETWPDGLLLIGDQVYADEPSDQMLEFIKARRDISVPPGHEAADFEEYTALYRESFTTAPSVRWVLSTISTSMIFDDHDVRDDWNISEAWVRDMRALGWWDDRIVGALMSYWIYQHIGNLSPAELGEYPIFQAVQNADDAGPLLREFAFRADRFAEENRWSYMRDFGGTRLIVMDSRATRLLDGGRRDMIDDPEWRWIEERAVGGRQHLVFVSSVPFLLAPGLHDLEAWSEAVRVGKWGRTGARLGEKVRRAIDLEHWGAFAGSFAKFMELLRALSAGERGRAPVSITVLSGDVHYAYVAEIRFPRAARALTPVHQLVLSPMRNPLTRSARMAHRIGVSKVGRVIGWVLAHTTGAARPPVKWKVRHGPWFHNQLGTLHLRGTEALFKIEWAVTDDDGDPFLRKVFQRRLAGHGSARRRRRWRRLVRRGATLETRL